MSITTHKTLPAYAEITRDDRGLPVPDPEGRALWSGEAPPPAIGDRVRIAVNGIGMATVISYFVQEGYLGVLTEVDAWPENLAKQNGDNRSCHVFGIEIR